MVTAKGNQFILGAACIVASMKSHSESTLTAPLIHISRNGVKAGSWSEDIVLQKLGRGELLESDYFWKEGMSEWQMLEYLQSQPFSISDLPEIPKKSGDNVQEFPIRFGAALRMDKFGFIGDGYLKITDERIEVSGQQEWNTLLKFALVILTAVILSFLAAMTFGVGVVLIPPALLIVHSVCASPGSVSFLMSELNDLRRSRKTISFCVPDPETKKLKRMLFHAEDEKAAKQIEVQLQR